MLMTYLYTHRGVELQKFAAKPFFVSDLSFSKEESYQESIKRHLAIHSLVKNYDFFISTFPTSRSSKEMESLLFFLNWPNPASFCLFSFFSQYNDKYITNLTINEIKA